MRFRSTLGMAILLVVGIAQVSCANGDDGSWTGFLGRFHPVVLHFPIGLIIGLLLLEAASVFGGDPRQGDTGRWIMLGVSAISGVLASVFGIFLSWEATYDEHLLWEHKWTGIGVSVTIVLAAIARLIFNRHEDGRMLWAYRFMVLVSAGLLMPAGHHGGQLTHGTEFLAEDIPAEIAFLAPLLGGEHAEVAVPAGDNYFTRDILPILEAKCFECHSAEKQKGDLRMDTLEAILEAGESGRPCVVPGNISESYMIELMLLPGEHEDVMPPSGKPQMEPEEILQLARWVSRGAPWGDYTPPEPVERSAEEVEVDAEGATGEVTAIVTADEVMELFFEEPPARISAAMAEEPADRKARRELLKVVFNEVNRLAEAHNLLFSRTDEEYMMTPEWAALTIEGRDAAIAITDYLKDRDWEYTELRSRYEVFINTCNRCHDYFETGEDPIVAWPEPEPDE